MTSFALKQLSRFFVRRSHRLQKGSALRDPALWGLGVTDDDHLAVDGIDAAGLLELYGSPLMVVNRPRLSQDVASLQAAMSEAPAGSKVLYSYKTNCIPGVLAEIHKLGIGAEVISPFELWLAERLGNRGDDIVFNGVGKTEESLARAVELGVLSINIDHLEEINRLLALRRLAKGKIRVGLRLGLFADSQFGLDVESGEAIQACRQVVASPELFELVSVHFSGVSNARNNRLHRRCLARAMDFVRQVKQETGIEVQYLNVGGGYGVPTTRIMSRSEYAIYRLFGALPRPPEPPANQPIDAFIREIAVDIHCFCARHGLRELKLLVEPGRFITSRSQFLLTRVNAIKKKPGGRYFALTDAGKISLTYPCDYEYHEMFVADRVNAPLTDNYTVVGRICTPADWMVKNRLLPCLQPGDVLAVMDAGAYFNSYSANFSFPRPAVIMISGGRATVIREEESFAHLVSMDRGVDRSAESDPSAYALKAHE